MSLQGKSIAEKIALNVRRDGDCLRWTGTHNAKGYGHLKVNGTHRGVHRIAYELAHGPIAVGLEIDHLCRVRDCVNIEHLDAVTHAENIARSQPYRVEECPSGHPYTPENTLTSTNDRGYKVRRCRICKNDRQRASRAARSAA